MRATASRGSAVEVAVIGSFSLDENIGPKGAASNVLGGAPVYSGSTFSRLGLKAGICSTIGGDQKDKALKFCKSMGIDFKGLKVSGERTLTFKNVYDEEENRVQWCYNIPEKISKEDIPEEYLKCKAFYISPLMNEVALEVLDRIRGEDKILMLDPQGLMRRVDEEGKVRIVFDKKELEKFFQKVDIVKVGKDEAKATGLSENEILKTIIDSGAKIGIVTRGKEPVKVSWEKKTFEAQTLNVKVEDPTGAGDVFGAAFLTEYLKSKNVEKAVKFANIAAGLKIRYRGPKGFPAQEDIEKLL